MPTYSQVKDYLRALPANARRDLRAMDHSERTELIQALCDCQDTDEATILPLPHRNQIPFTEIEDLVIRKDEAFRVLSEVAHSKQAQRQALV